MTTKTVYQTDELGIYVGLAIADASPLEPGVWLIPALCVEQEPPSAPEGQAARWDGLNWKLIDCYRGLTAYNTTTREPLVIDRVGPLPAGYTLEAPGPGQVWEFGQWVDDVPAVVEALYQERLLAVDTACSQEITGGFWSQVLGDRHRYSSTLEDQMNLTGAARSGADLTYPCLDAEGIKAFRPHTADQLRQLAGDFTVFRLGRLEQAYQLKLQLQEARDAQDIEALTAISWETVAV